MLRRELQELLAALGQGEYRTAAGLAELLDISEKTARLRLKELDQELENHGAKVISKARYGYQLVVEDEDRFHNLTETADKLRGGFVIC